MSEVHAHPLLDQFDALLVDLDGTVFAGTDPIDGAKEGLAGRTVRYVTNNASRAPEEVSEHLNSLGFPARPEEVLTSAMAACELGKKLLASDADAASAHGTEVKAYVIGAESFKELARRAGFAVVDSADDNPDVVFHGHSPSNNWASLSEGALAIRKGAKYIASNLDTTLPSERGLLIGNGSLVAAVTSATGVTPESAGKPGPAMFTVAADSAGASHPLAVGDRLNTDIAGGNAAGIPTLCTVTGVSGHWDILAAVPAERPTYIAANMRDYVEGWSAARAEDAEDRVVAISAGDTADTAVMAAAALAAVAPIVWEILDDATSGIDNPRDISFTAATSDAADAVQAALAAWR